MKMIFNFTTKIFFALYYYCIVFLGFIITSWIIYSRFIRERLPKDTGQPNPDYLFRFNENTKTWYKYYDLKTGKISANKGHIFCAKPGLQYEAFSKKLLESQYTCYFKNKLIRDKLTELIKNDSLTWGQRNKEFHIFLKENMLQLKGINPSIVIESQLLYDVGNAKPDKGISEVVNFAGPGCLESYENSINVVAESIYSGGSLCVKNYIRIPSANPKIVKILENMFNDNINFLLNNV